MRSEIVYAIVAIILTAMICQTAVMIARITAEKTVTVRLDADILLYMTRDQDHSIVSSAENGWAGNDCIMFKAEKNRDGARGFDVEARFDLGTQTFTEVRK